MTSMVVDALGDVKAQLSSRSAITRFKYNETETDDAVATESREQGGVEVQ